MDSRDAGHKANIRECNIIGDNVSIGTLSAVELHVRIAARVRIHTQAFIPEFTTLESGASIGPNVVCSNTAYPLATGVKGALKGPYIEERAKVGANATLLPGVRLGKDCLIGAGAVVTRDVEPGIVVVGNPARPLKAIHELPYE